MSSWRCSHGRDGHGTGCRGVGTGGPVFPLRRHGTQSLTSVSMSRSMPGHHMRSRHLCLSFTIPRCPSCAIDSTRARRLLGTTVQRPLETQTSLQHESSSRNLENGMSSSGTFFGHPDRMYVRRIVSVPSHSDSCFSSSKDTADCNGVCSIWISSGSVLSLGKTAGDGLLMDRERRSATTLSLPGVNFRS